MRRTLLLLGLAVICASALAVSRSSIRAELPFLFFWTAAPSAEEAASLPTSPAAAAAGSAMSSGIIAIDDLADDAQWLLDGLAALNGRLDPQDPLVQDILRLQADLDAFTLRMQMEDSCELGCKEAWVDCTGQDCHQATFTAPGKCFDDRMACADRCTSPTDVAGKLLAKMACERGCTRMYLNCSGQDCRTGGIANLAGVCLDARYTCESDCARFYQ